jgi:hypothetical protein
MKIKNVVLAMSVCLILAITNANGGVCGKGITYTSSFPWVSGNGTITTGTVPTSTINNGIKNNDTIRLKDILTQCQGKIIFDESEYYINDTLTVYAFRILEGSGTGSFTKSNTPAYPNNTPVYPSSKIVQMANKPIFRIGSAIYDVAIRDLAMVGGIATTNTDLIGILAEGGFNQQTGTPSSTCTATVQDNCSSINFQFSNLKFDSLNKGIYVNAKDPETQPGNQSSAHQWQFDNVSLDHTFFVNCKIGIHLNSYNSGWSMNSLDFLIPAGGTLNAQTDCDATCLAGKTIGVYLERNTYTSMNLLVGNGPTTGVATALIYVKEHSNLLIQNAVSEIFYKDIVVYGNTRNQPINLTSNHFQSGIDIREATVYSSGNQYSAPAVAGYTSAIARGNSQIYSVGDKFCNEGDDVNCDEARGFTLQDNARNIFMTTQNGSVSQVPLSISKDVYTTTSSVNNNKFTSAPALSLIAPTISDGPLLRIGRGPFVYNITRNEYSGFDAGYLEFKASQQGYGGYSFKTQAGSSATVAINYNGSVTYGSVDYSALGTPANGTVVYCPTCQQTSTCAGGGTGALAKRINGAWQCN